jgi:hypothetical protein
LKNIARPDTVSPAGITPKAYIFNEPVKNSFAEEVLGDGEGLILGVCTNRDVSFSN